MRGAGRSKRLKSCGRLARTSAWSASCRTCKQSSLLKPKRRGAMKFCPARGSPRIWRPYLARQRIDVKSRKSRIRRQTFLLSCAVLLAAASAISQESSSKPGGSSASAPSETTNSGGPSAALKVVLSAACSQDQTEFVRFLTIRNKEAFSRMTPPSRVALMKRFVLLNEPGKPTATADPAARPILPSQTPTLTTQMHTLLPYLPDTTP